MKRSKAVADDEGHEHWINHVEEWHGEVDDGGNAEHGDQQRCDDGEGDDEFIGKLAAGKFVEIFAGGDGEADGGRQAGEDDGNGEAVCADAAEEALVMPMSSAERSMSAGKAPVAPAPP